MEERLKARNKDQQQCKQIDMEISLKIAAKENGLQTTCDKAEELQTQQKDRQLQKRTKKPHAGLWNPKHLSLIADKNNELESNSGKQKLIWKNYLKDLFRSKQRIEELPEIHKGGDQITSDRQNFKVIIDIIITMLTRAFKVICESRIILQDWLISTYIAIPNNNFSPKM